MRRLYLSLAAALLVVVLLLCCSAGVQAAALRKVGRVTSPEAGQTVAFNRVAQSSEGEEADMWLCALASDPTMLSLFTNGTNEPYTDYAAVHGL